MDAVLAVPRQFFQSDLWTDPVLARAYLDLQARAEDGRIAAFSRRTASVWWGVSYRQTGRVMAELEDRNLVYYPEGQPANRPYPIALTDPWGGSATGSANGSAENGVTTPQTARFSVLADQQTDQQTDQRTVVVQVAASGSAKSEQGGSAENGVAARFSSPFDDEADQQNEAGADQHGPTPFPSLSPEPPNPPLTPPVPSSANAPEGTAAPKRRASKQRKKERQGELLPELLEAQKEVRARQKEQEEQERKERTPSNATTHQLMALVIEQGLAGQIVSGPMYGKQAAVLKRLVRDNGEDAVRRAIRGMAGVYPYSGGEAWDAFTLERHFAKALAAAGKIERAREDGDLDALPEAEREAERQRRIAEQRAKREAEEREREEKARREAEAWRNRVRERIMAEPEEVRRRHWEEAKEVFSRFGLRIPEAKRKAFLENLALANYGKKIGDPPPSSMPAL